MNKSADLPVHDPSQVGDVRRAASAMADAEGMNETEVGKVAIIATELANNVLLHGGGGRIVLQRLDYNEGSPGVRLLALDQGRGIRNVGEAIRDGYSTGGTAGEGLGAIRRLSSVFDLYSLVDKGTVVLSEVHAITNGTPTPVDIFEIGSVVLPYPGEDTCGDSVAFIADQTRGRALVADGLGHGPLAADASRKAIQVFSRGHEEKSSEPLSLMKLLHEALRSTRGAAAATALIDLESNTVRFCGLGNVAAAIFSSEEQRILVSHSGIVGHQAHKFQEFSYPWEADSVLILASDGISTQWHLDRYPGILRRHAALIAGILVRDYSRGRDDIGVLALRQQPGHDRWESSVR